MFFCVHMQTEIMRLLRHILHRECCVFDVTCQVKNSFVLEMRLDTWVLFHSVRLPQAVSESKTQGVEIGLVSMAPAVGCHRPSGSLKLLSLLIAIKNKPFILYDRYFTRALKVWNGLFPMGFFISSAFLCHSLPCVNCTVNRVKPIWWKWPKIR